MTILSTVCTKLLCTNAHLGRLVAAHHLKVYIRGSRNGIAILDSDKTLICLRTALHFIGSLIRKKGRSFFLKTNHFFIYSIMEKMIYSIMQKMGSCINDSQWKIGAFLTNSYANPKKFRSRKKKIHFGLNQQPDCVVIPNPDRKSSVILEANRSQIPIASLVDFTIPWEFYKRITYPIPANDTIQFIYVFLNSITKTVIRERRSAMKGARALSTGRQLGQQLRTYSHSSLMRKKKHFFASASKYRCKAAAFIYFYFLKFLLILPRGLFRPFRQIPANIRLTLFFFILSILVSVESAAAASSSDIVIAHQPGSSGYTTNYLVDYILETSSAPSGEPSVNQAAPSSEPSVNQATPEFNPVHEDEGQRALLQQNLFQEISQLYRKYLSRSGGLVMNPGFTIGTDIAEGALSTMETLEVHSSSIDEMEELLRDIQRKPGQLDPLFKNAFEKRMLGGRLPWDGTKTERIKKELRKQP